MAFKSLVGHTDRELIGRSMGQRDIDGDAIEAGAQNVEALEAEVDTRFAETSKAAGAFLVGSDALKPLLEAIAVAGGEIQ